MKNSSFHKELIIINKLDKIQKEYNNNIKLSGNNVKILLEKLSKESEAVTSKPVNADMLYLHASVYSLLDDQSYITSEKFIDNMINETNYTHSTKITVNKDDTNGLTTILPMVQLNVFIMVILIYLKIKRYCLSL